MTLKTAIVCMAYGTDSTGRKISPQSERVLREAIDADHANRRETEFILQGGYRYSDGPMESVLMRQWLRDYSGGKIRDDEMHLDVSSMNTIQGAEEVLWIALRLKVEKLVIIAEQFHIWRVRYTFRKIFNLSGIELEFRSAYPIFGGNSQSRLNSWWNWWPWEIAARIYTILFVH